MTSPENDSKSIQKDQGPEQEQTSGLPAGLGVKMGTLKATCSVGFYLKIRPLNSNVCACSFGVWLPTSPLDSQNYV
jgi:hypothetical protein